MTATTPEVFAEQMGFLHKTGYSVVDLAQLKRRMSAGEEISAKSVTLTFDDGLKDFYFNAFPILRQFGFTATVFLATDFVDKGWRFNDQQCLSWDEVRELRKYGISFGSHTVTHPVLRTIAKKRLEYELAASKERIESELGEKIDCFAYPYAFPEADSVHLENLISVLAESGYRCGVSTRIGTTTADDNIFCMKRIPVNSLDDGILFEAKLNGAYDWLHSLQVLYKHLRPHENGRLHSTPVSQFSRKDGIE